MLFIHQHLNRACRPMFLDRSRQLFLQERGELHRCGRLAREVKNGRVWGSWVPPGECNSSIEPARRLRGPRQLVADNKSPNRREKRQRIGPIESIKRKRVKLNMGSTCGNREP